MLTLLEKIVGHITTHTYRESPDVDPLETAVMSDPHGLLLLIEKEGNVPRGTLNEWIRTAREKQIAQRKAALPPRVV